MQFQFCVGIVTKAAFHEMVMPDFLAIPVPPLVYLVPKEFSKLLIGLVKIYCALLTDNSGGTHENAKNY